MFSRVYDLQLNNRTSIYYRLFLKKPEWSGVVKGASHRHGKCDWKQMHAFERHRAMLKELDIEVEFPDLSWITSDRAFPELKKPYFLLVPGCAPTRPEKRWPGQKYGELGLHLTRLGYDVAVIGTAAERNAVDCIVNTCPAVHDLAGKTSLYDVAALARGAAGAVGNDTGPLHLIAMAGCSTTALFFSASNPDLCRPIGRAVTVARSDSPNDLSVDEVLKTLGHFVGIR
jgi:ADP-heptose:LPS heptosyltransferase